MLAHTLCIQYMQTKCKCMCNKRKPKVFHMFSEAAVIHQMKLPLMRLEKGEAGRGRKHRNNCVHVRVHLVQSFSVNGGFSDHLLH